MEVEMKMKTGPLLSLSAIPILFAVFAFTPAYAASNQVSIAGQAPAICLAGHPWPDAYGVVANSRVARFIDVGTEGYSEESPARSRTYRILRIMCNTGGRMITINGSRENFRARNRREINVGRVGAFGKKMHYRLRGESGPDILPKLATAKAANTAHYYIASPSELAIEMDLSDADFLKAGKTHRVHLKITIGPSL